jgi:hypothetical protein
MGKTANGTYLNSVRRIFLWLVIVVHLATLSQRASFSTFEALVDIFLTIGAAISFGLSFSNNRKLRAFSHVFAAFLAIMIASQLSQSLYRVAANARSESAYLLSAIQSILVVVALLVLAVLSLRDAKKS